MGSVLESNYKTMQIARCALYWGEVEATAQAPRKYYGRRGNLALAFLDSNRLVGFDVWNRLSLAAWPNYFERYGEPLFGFAKSKSQR